MPSDEMTKMLSCIGRKVHYKYPGDEIEKKGTLTDRTVIETGSVGPVPYWSVVDLIDFAGETEPMIRFGYYRKPKQVLNWGSQTTATEPISTWKKILVTAATEKKWFRDLLNEVMSEVQTNSAS